jgi:hypothetical protein
MEDHDRGLAFDLPKLISRRRALAVLAGSVASGALAACGSSRSDSAIRDGVRHGRRRHRAQAQRGRLAIGER